MALIKCNECGREVSDSCQTCPNCGADIQQQVYDSLSDEEKAALEAKNNNVRKWVDLVLLIGAVTFTISETQYTVETADYSEGAFAYFFLISCYAVSIFLAVVTFKRFFGK
jgi:hypothetical protein